MPLQTTMVGSYPKPAYLPVSDWFRQNDMIDAMDKYHERTRKELEELYHKAEKEVIDEQCSLGISVITNGEIRRENYYLHLCRHVKGFDFQNYEILTIRNGACTHATPVIVQKLEFCGDTFAWKEWKTAQDMSSKPVKYTLPGPLTIMKSVANKFYDDPQGAYTDLIKIINREILDLVHHGCKRIQLDEPVFNRNPSDALEFGVKNAERCFDGVGDDVEKTIHLCCGYPTYLDQDDYQKADPQGYHTLAQALDQSIFDCISIEDCERRNDLSLFEKYKNKTLVVGVIKIASSKIESIEDIRARVQEILNVFPKERLILAPDCGVGFLVDDTLRMTKLKNMVTVANEF